MTFTIIEVHSGESVCRGTQHGAPPHTTGIEGEHDPILFDSAEDAADFANLELLGTWDANELSIEPV